MLAYFFIQEHTDRIRAEAAQQPLREEALNARESAQERDDSLVAVRGRATELAAALGASTRRAEALSDSLAAAVAEDVVQVDVALADLTGIFAEIREHLPEPALPLVDSAQVRVTAMATSAHSTAAAFRAQTESFARFRVESGGTLSATEARAVAAEASAMAWQRTAAAEAARADNAERLATRGVWDRVKGSLPLMSVQGTVAGLIGAGIGIAATR